MQELLKRARVILISAVIALTAFTYVGIFSPMKEELQKSIIENFSQLTDSKYQSLDHIIKKSVEGAESLASRTMIRNKISEYLNQDIAFDELVEYTQPKYEDGAKVLNRLMIAERVVEQNLVAKYINENNSEELTIGKKSFNDDIETKIEYVNGKVMFRVCVPITSGEKILGYDSLVYDLTEEINLLGDNTYKVQLVTGQQFDSLLKNTKHIRTKEKIMLYENNENVYAFIKLQSENYFVVEVVKDTLFYTVDRLVARIVILWVVVFTFLFVLIYVYIVRFANKELQQIEKSRDKYKGLAYRDKMTESYSKAFLEVWNETLRIDAHYYTMVMIDIDNFKTVNDQYGHLTGDEVLKAVAKALYISIREGDFLIRFGGDEFLILLKNMKEKDTNRIINRITDSIAAINQFDFNINISYGMSMIGLEDNFDEKFKIADNKMYSAKQKKKQNGKLKVVKYSGGNIE